MLEQMREVDLDFVFDSRRLLRAMLIASASVPFLGKRRSSSAKPIRVRSRLMTSSMSERSRMVKLGLSPMRLADRRSVSIGEGMKGTASHRASAIADQLLDAAATFPATPAG